MTSSLSVRVVRETNTVRERICGAVSTMRSAVAPAGMATENSPCPSLVAVTPLASMATPLMGAPPLSETTCPVSVAVVDAAGVALGAVGLLGPLLPPRHAANGTSSADTMTAILVARPDDRDGTMRPQILAQP